MGIDAISGISSYNTAAISAVSMENGGLSEETIKKLKALGIDPTKVKSEQEAKVLIAKAEGKNNSSQNLQVQKRGSQVDMLQLQMDIKDLGKKIGVDVLSIKNLDDVSKKLEIGVQEYVKAASAQGHVNAISSKNLLNETKLKHKPEDIQIKFKDIKSRIDEVKAEKNEMYAGQDMMSMLNRMSLGL